MSLRRSLAVLVVLAGLAAASPAQAAPPSPFGHPCQPRLGVLACPTEQLTDRVPSFDGTPLDVDVWLPASGDGPFPTIVMAHGWGSRKTSFQGDAEGYSAAFFARRGYAVVTPTGRGWGRSCGQSASRTQPACERGWVHNADQRVDVRDLQHLLGLLVDQGVARADALAATGISLGGGLTLQLAALRDRVRLPDGSLAPWTSPRGTPLRLAAAWARWPWSDPVDALFPNGAQRAGGRWVYPPDQPWGVMKRSYFDGLRLLAAFNYLASDRLAPNGFGALHAIANRGEPYPASLLPLVEEVHRFSGLRDIPLGAEQTPTIIQTGWTDSLFPAWQGLRAYDQLRRANPAAPVWVQLGDLGHSRAKNFTRDDAVFDGQGLALFDAALQGRGALPAPGRQTVYGSNCREGAAGGIGPWTTSDVTTLARGALRLGATGGTVSSSGGDPFLASRINGLFTDPCDGFRLGSAAGTMRLIAPVRRATTLMGFGELRLRYRAIGPDALLVARVWDRDPRRKVVQLVDRGVLRLPAGGRATLTLDGNAWRFPKGHQVVIELLGRDAPTFRPANRAFRVQVDRVDVRLPVLEPGTR